MQFTINAEKQPLGATGPHEVKMIFDVTTNTTLLRIVRSDGKGGTQTYAIDTLSLIDNFDEARREREAMA